jgi:hypothetical protein
MIEIIKTNGNTHYALVDKAKPARPGQDYGVITSHDDTDKFAWENGIVLYVNTGGTVIPVKGRFTIYMIWYKSDGKYIFEITP